METHMDDLYNNDYYSWIIQQSGLLKEKKFNELDLDNLIEEVESMGRSELRALTSKYVILLMHLLKWENQPTHRSKSWEISIRNSRCDVLDILDESPGLKSQYQTCFEKAYDRARREASKETGLDISFFPIDCPWNMDIIMENDWLP